MRVLCLLSASVFAMSVSGCIANIAPNPPSVEPRPSLLAGDTVVVGFRDARANRDELDSLDIGFQRTIERRYPAAVIRTFDSTASGRRALVVLGRLDYYDAPFTTGMTNNWHAAASLGLTVSDHRISEPVTISSVVTRTAVRSNIFGSQSKGDAMRDAFDSAMSSVVAIVDSVVDPSLRATAIGLRAATLADYLPYSESGTGSIEGQAFLTTRGGDVKRAAGRLVTLDPATTLGIDWYNRIGSTSVLLFDATPPDSIFTARRRTTTADADGRFRFDSLPAGSYIVRTTVTWEIPGTISGTMETQGGVVSAIVPLKAGERKKIVLSQTRP